MLIGEGTQTRRQLDPLWAERSVATREDYALARQVMIEASKNYTFAGRFLPAEKRRHVEALYAFLRVGDDLVDVSHEGFDSPESAISYWQETYHEAFHTGTSPDPVMRAYLHTAQTFGIPQQIMAPYFKAMRQDLTITRYQTFDDLLEYVGGSAMPVGRAMTYILGVRPPYQFRQALGGADALSIAMQLSNFWRDIGEDWQRGRVYLPQADLRRFNVTEADLADGKVTDNLKELLRFQIERTESFYHSANQAVPMLASGRWAVQSGLMIYKAIIEDLSKRGYDPFSRRARANTLGKLKLVARAWFQSR
jgi:phytoene synthase